MEEKKEIEFDNEEKEVAYYMLKTMYEVKKQELEQLGEWIQRIEKEQS